MKIDIDKFEVGAGRAFIIAEVGNNHNGSLQRAKEMVDLAIAAGADCAKFQMRHMAEVYRARTLEGKGEDLGTEYLTDLLNRFELPVDEQKELADYCAQRGILYMCTPWDRLSVEVLEGMGVPAYKVASADLTNLPLLDLLAKTGKPLILSTGMSREEEIRITVDFLNARKTAFILLHCNSTYPAPLQDINLKWMSELAKIHPLFGYSGHERGIAVTLAAVALGAMVVERHFTLDRTMEGPDHPASLEPDDLKRLVDGVREIEQALGEGGVRKLSQGEMINRENLAKSLVAATGLKVGTVLGPEHIRVRSPGQGISAQKYEALLGRTLARDMAEEDFFFAGDLNDGIVGPGTYRFDRPWGVPVRYHDFEEYRARISPDLFEFHLSYWDMELKPQDYLTGPYEQDFVVHAPELFAGSRLLDLATPDDAYRSQSVAEIQRVIDITRGLKRYFPKTSRPMIVTNIGGFTMDEPLTRDVITSYYERFARSLGELDAEGVEVVPQTMAPFPWHFGGQRYQNLFVKPDEIVEWCAKLGLRMCFDVSHSRLTCNHIGYDFYDFSAKVGGVTAYLHLGDASGVNGEGLQIGEGDIDFPRLGKVLKGACPAAGFIPEIWQGHKNLGEGFWIALQRLEGSL